MSKTDVLARRGFTELLARARALELLDEGTGCELCGPFERLESPWLPMQGITPQADDGVAVLRGQLEGRDVVTIAIEPGFQGGGIGEVSGAKISQALRLAADTSTAAVLLLETGGVRLQEANLGLNAVAEISAALLALRPLAPIVGVIAGPLGCFGGLGIVAGLCSRLVMTAEGRLGLNGPSVIELEAGPDELDSTDRALVWGAVGGEPRASSGLVDALVADDIGAVREAVAAALDDRAHPGSHRSERLVELEDRFSNGPRRGEGATSAPSRGETWMRALVDAPPKRVLPSVLVAANEQAAALAVVPDLDHARPRVRAGQLGPDEALALARCVRSVIAEDATAGRRRRAILAVVDVPGQAYGLEEERLGLHQAAAAAVDAYAAARTAGHPVVAVIVGGALSAGFLAHGLQASGIVALEAPGVEVHAMSMRSAASITRRSEADLEALATAVAPLSYRVRDWATLGICDALVSVRDADSPDADEVAAVRDAIAHVLVDIPVTLEHRMDRGESRAASRRVRAVLERDWARASP